MTGMIKGLDALLPVQGLKLRCRVGGVAGAPWLVFSNSLMTDLSLWDDQVVAYAGRFRILRYDQRGHGGSPVPPGPCHFDDLADALVAVLDAFDVEVATLVGVSRGGVTVLGAARHPARGARAAVCDCQPASTPASAVAWGERIVAAEARGMAALVGPTLARWFPPGTVQADPPALRRVRDMIAGTPLQGYDCHSYPALLRCPAAFIAGAEDGVVPQMMRRMAAACPGSSFTGIEGAGHLPNVEQPARFDAALDVLLARPPARA